MRPIDFEGANITLLKPEQMSDEQCTPLRAMQGKTEDGYHYFVTAWMPNVDDLAAINRGEPIYMQTVSSTFPPSALYTVNENNEINE